MLFYHNGNFIFLEFYCPASQSCSCKCEHQLGYKMTDSFEASVFVWQLVLVTLNRFNHSWLQFWSFLCFLRGSCAFLVHSFKPLHRTAYCILATLVIKPDSTLHWLNGIDWCLRTWETATQTSQSLYDSVLGQSALYISSRLLLQTLILIRHNLFSSQFWLTGLIHIVVKHSHFYLYFSLNIE